MAGAKRGRWEAYFTLAANKTITFTDTSGATVVTITAGDYTMTTLIAFIDAALDADWTITFSGGESGTGKITISSGLVNFSVAWGDTTTRDLMGFAADISGASTAQTGTKHVKTVWLPDTVKYTAHGDETSTNGDAAAMREIPASQTEGPTGTVKTIVSAATKKTYTVRYQGLSRARTKLIGESVTNESLETFWYETQKAGHSYCAGGNKIRLYWDADASVYSDVCIVGMHNFDPGRLVDGWPGRYDVTFPRLVRQP